MNRFRSSNPDSEEELELELRRELESDGHRQWSVARGSRFSDLMKTVAER